MAVVGCERLQGLTIRRLNDRVDAVTFLDHMICYTIVAISLIVHCPKGLNELLNHIDVLLIHLLKHRQLIFLIIERHSNSQMNHPV